MMKLMLEASRNSIDDIIDLYKRDVDLSLLEASARRSLDERMQALQEFEYFRAELQSATARAIQAKGGERKPD